MRLPLRGTVAVVTGAGSGIGRALSRDLAGRGATVAACDVHPSSAEETVASLGSSTAMAHRAFEVDVADRASVHELAAAVVGAFGHVDVVVNNAGVLGQVAPVEQLSDDEIEWILGIDLWGVIHGTRAFLPHLRARPHAALVNVSSLAGLMGSLGNSAYFAAKFGVRGFTEAVRAELQPTNVAVTVVFPGVVKTNLAASHPAFDAGERAEAVRRYNAKPGLQPEVAARRILDGVERGKTRVVVGADARLVDVLIRLFPGGIDRVANRFLRKAANANRPDGRPVF